MTSMLLELPEPPRLSDARCRLVAAGPALWRVVAPSGRIIGHLQAVLLEHGASYRARRFQSSAGTFRDIGDFWSVDDAVECLRLAT